MVTPPRLWIHQLPQPRSFSAVADYFPSMAPGDAKEELLTVMGYWSTPVNVTPNHSQGISIYRECPYPPVFLLLGYCLFYPSTTA